MVFGTEVPGRIEPELDQVRREIRARRIQIAQPSEPFLLEWGALPGEIRLTPGELHIQFSSAFELLQRRMLLAQKNFRGLAWV
jgi:hypothetical protein